MESCRQRQTMVPDMRITMPVVGGRELGGQAGAGGIGLAGQSTGRPLGDFGIGPYQKDENRPQNRTQIGPKIGLIFYKTLKIGPI